MGILDLPLDVVLIIFHYSSASAIARLLSSCRILHALTRDDTIWRHLAGLYGLRELTYFGCKSYYVAYTGLLHTYGPLIGLWASDLPYTGNILQFTLEPGNKHQCGGIVGYTWRFRVLEPEELDAPEVPETPRLIRVMRIGFPGVDLSNGDHHFASRIRFRTPSSSTNQSLFLHTRQGRFIHPEFPDALASQWLDRARQLPRLEERHSPEVDQTEAVSAISRPRVHVIFTAPTDQRKPRAISFECESLCLHSSGPFLSFENRIPFSPRYYPLHGSDSTAYTAPHSDLCTLKSLTGLWFGTHGPHGTECLYVEWNVSAQVLIGRKITGDENVPRGAVSWTATTTEISSIPSSRQDAYTRAFGNLSQCRLYPGMGTGSGRGFMPHQRDSHTLAVGVIAVDEIRILWVDLNEISRYIRYTG
ncbi:hypothetical protein OBBRIDRAFT_818389 [Obba rivulosa]|uniref:F-box domain-containing protein n=1 Tax=Obba rivulosa TaxID=1052685 RepID=A0A8E2AX91_9APHY|nr:hypothetical protein OBBRIDRAFT_818389 [Obba rivulosa]